MITTDPKKRKGIPVYTGFVEYFPLAIAAVAELSRVGNDQHNPGSPLKWDRSKSGDERDALMRHLLQSGTVDKDGVRHSTKVAWRAMAALQKEIELSTNDNAAIERDIEKSEYQKNAAACRSLLTLLTSRPMTATPGTTNLGVSQGSTTGKIRIPLVWAGFHRRPRIFQNSNFQRWAETND